MPFTSFKNIEGAVFQTGNATTDSLGRVTVSLSCFRPDETPCVTVSSFGVDGNSNVNSSNLFLVGSTWQIDIITSSPGIRVYYMATKSNRIDTAGPAVPINLITQDLFDIVTQDDELIITQ
jgi:hypothetical protein